MTNTTRREFLEKTGQLALGVALAASFAERAKATTTVSDFDINKSFADFMKDIGGNASDGGGRVIFTGRDPILRSHFRIASSMAIPAMAAGVGAAAIWRERTGQAQDLSVDLRESIYNVNPILTLVQQQRQKMGRLAPDDPVANSFSFVPTVNGKWYQAPLGVGNPLSFAIFDTKDGRKVTITGVYPHLYDRALNLLKAVPKRESIIEAIQQWNSTSLEEAMAEQRVVGAIHRTAEEWAQHPEGQYLAGTPVIDIQKIGESDPVPYSAKPEQPLSGVRTLALTHVIAGSCAARTLAEYGAEVLHVARDQSFEHEGLVTDVNVGMRSTFLDLKHSRDSRALSALLPKADVFIESFSGRAVERLGFGVEEVAKSRPGIIYLTVRCYGWDGPWRDKAGFDMEGLTSTGFTMIEGGGRSPEFSSSYALPEDVAPGFPPTLVMNDYIAGYLGAAGVLAALRRRARDGGSYHVRISLARAAMWYQSLGTFATTDFEPTAEQRMVPPETVTSNTCYGEIYRLAPQAKLSKTPGRWRTPLVAVRGGDRPTWEG